MKNEKRLGYEYQILPSEKKNKLNEKEKSEKEKEMCGCYDSSPGLHGPNVEFSPLNQGMWNSPH